MIRCLFCDTRNSPGSLRCRTCGAELSSEGTESRAANDPVDLREEVLAIVRSQGKIAAIKHYREARGSNLKEAKDAVEAWMAETGTIPSPGSAGCGATSLLAAVVLGVFWLLGLR